VKAKQSSPSALEIWAVTRKRPKHWRVRKEKDREAKTERRNACCKNISLSLKRAYTTIPKHMKQTSYKEGHIIKTSVWTHCS
jgi:hypothetical protein